MKQELNNLEQQIIEEIKVIIKELGTFPRQKDFRKIHRNDILTKISKSGKGMNYFRNLLGYKPLHRQNYWSEERIIDGLKILAERLGRWPITKDIKNSEFKQIIKAVRRYGGIKPFQEKLGYSHITRWTEEKILNNIKILCIKLGRFPSLSDMSISLHGAISRRQSINYYREKLGYPLTVIPNQWKDWEIVKTSIKPLIKNDQFPTQQILNSNGISTTVIKNWGGMEKLAEKMGYNLSTKRKASDGHYVSSMYELLFDDFLYSRGIEHEVNGFIGSTRFRYDFKIENIYIEIWGYSKNKLRTKIAVLYNKKRRKKEKLYKKFGLNLVSIECNLFNKNYENIEQYFIKLVESLGFNSAPCMAGYSVKEILIANFNMTEEKVITRLQEIISEINHFPSKQELNSIGEKNLVYAINFLGGINKFMDLMGYEIQRVPVGYWTENTIISELTEIMKQYGKFPSDYFLRNINRKDLSQAIAKNGGINYYRSILSKS